MNPHEQAMLENFLDQLVRVRGTRKIPEAVRSLGQAAATAAGVAGGEFLFQGLEHMFSPHGASAASHDAQPFIPQDVTVNNYYGSDARPNGADDDHPGWTGDPDPADEFVSDDDDDDDGDDADFI